MFIEVDKLSTKTNFALSEKVSNFFIVVNFWPTFGTDYRLFFYIFNRLWLRTVNALSQAQATGSKAQPYTDEEITKDPLVILRCDRRLFR